jgi:hypothetical protein
MAKVNSEIIHVLRKTAATLEVSAHYQWGHMGSCNCGFLAQEITKLTRAEIHRRALMRHGDWTEQLNDYCPINGLPFDDIIAELIEFGFDSDDLQHLEKLSDPTILRSLPPGEQILMHNHKKDVIRYLRQWANLLEDELVKDVCISAMNLSFEAALK